MGHLPDLRGMFAVIAIVAAVVGWALIEVALWLWRSISITFIG